MLSLRYVLIDTRTGVIPTCCSTVFTLCVCTFIHGFQHLPGMQRANSETTRSPKTSSLTLSSKTSRRASFDSSATASHTKAIYGTTGPSREYVNSTKFEEDYTDKHRHGRTQTSSTQRPRRRATTTHSMSAKLANLSATLAKSSRSRS